MRSVRVMMVAGMAAAAIGAAANAADLPPVFYKGPPVPIEEFGGWYLRGDIGMTNQRVKNLDNALFPGTAQLVIRDKNFESGILFGIGAGYEFNRWLRADLTAEYRGETGFHGLDTWFDGANARFNNYTAKKSEWLFLANAYVDLGTWWSLTPFVGAGIGASRNTIHSFRDAGIDPGPPPSPTLAYADAASKWNFAWALHAGVAYSVTPGFTVELAYRYVNLGDAMSGDIIAYGGANLIYNPMYFRDITSHDLKVGMRWMLRDMPVYAPPPLITKG